MIKSSQLSPVATRDSGVITLLSKLKYLFLYAYEATEKMEEKAEVFAEERAKRMETFRAERDAATDRAHEKIADMRDQVKEQVQETLGNLGVATKSEIDDLKKLVTDLGKKVDTLAK